MKTIKVTDSVHQRLGFFGNKNDTYNDIIERLLNNQEEEFSDEQANDYNAIIAKFEDGNYEDTEDVDIEKEILQLKKELNYE